MGRSAKIRVQQFSVAIFLLITFLTQLLNTAGPLNGDFSRFMLPSEAFGVPPKLAERGIKPHSQSEFNMGWDGQFYYFMANDIFNRLETSKNVDNPPYRYQRIGQSLLAKVTSLFLFQSWVSPILYYLVGVVAVALATWMLSGLLSSWNISGFWSLLWSLSLGTQLTLQKGLPDAFADACLIIGLISLLRRNFFVSAITLGFAVLSREAYFIVVMILIAFSFLKLRGEQSQVDRQALLLLIPPFLFAAW